MLAAVVMPGGAKAERAAVGIDAPACEGTCGRLEIGFGVAPLAEREELEQLAGEVLVGRLAAALRVVEVDQHRRIARNLAQQRRAIAQLVAPQQRVLAVQPDGGLPLLEAGGEDRKR